MQDQAQLLDVLGAARRLKITPELLMSYVKLGAKGQSGRRLTMVEGANQNLFCANDLDDFDEYLRQPWAEAGQGRPQVSPAIQDYLKVEAAGGCARCVDGGPMEIAHIESWATSLSHHHHNLIRLCRNCHRLYDDGSIARSEIYEIKNKCVAALQKRLSRLRVSGWPIVGAPPLVSNLVGREEEVASTSETLATGRSLMIEGVGGIGKTQLMLRALRDVAQQRPVVWISVESITQIEALEAVVRSRCEQAQLPIGADLIGDLDENRVCLVIDGLERGYSNCDEISDFIEKVLGESDNIVVALTSQISIPSFKPSFSLRLSALTHDASFEVLTDGLSSEQITEIDAQRLLEFADGHPLTLNIISALVRHIGSGADVVTLLKAQGAEAVAMPRRHKLDAGTSLVRSLEVAFANLSKEERGLAWAVAMSPGGFRRDFHLHSAVNFEDVIPVSAELRGWHLIDIERDPAFDPSSPVSCVLTMLSPVRAFFQQRMLQEPIDARNAREKTLALHVAILLERIQTGFLQKDAIQFGLALMDRELRNAITMFELAAKRCELNPEFFAPLASITNSLMMYLFTAGYFSLGQKLMKKCAALAIKVGEIDDAMDALVQMQVLAERAGNVEGSAYALEEAEKIASSSDGVTFAKLRQMQSSSAEREGDFVLAAKLAQEALEIFEGIDGEDYHAAFAAFQLGRALEFSGRHDAALKNYEKTLVVWEARGDPINRGSTYHHIGNCQAERLSWDAAMAAYTSAAVIFAELEAVEYISNALGEAGHVLAHLQTLDCLPSKELAKSGLWDATVRLAQLPRTNSIRSKLGVDLRKMSGVVSLAAHAEARKPLLDICEWLREEIILPAAEIELSPINNEFKVYLWHVDNVAALCAFLSRDEWSEAEEEYIATLATLARDAFGPVLMEPTANWLTSYCQKIQGIGEVMQEDVLNLMLKDI